MQHWRCVEGNIYRISFRILVWLFYWAWHTQKPPQFINWLSKTLVNHVLSAGCVYHTNRQDTPILTHRCRQVRGHHAVSDGVDLDLDSRAGSTLLGNMQMFPSRVEPQALPLSLPPWFTADLFVSIYSSFQSNQWALRRLELTVYTHDERQAKYPLQEKRSAKSKIVFPARPLQYKSIYGDHNSLNLCLPIFESG